MGKRIVFDEASSIPRYTRLTAQYSCGHCFYNDIWIEEADIPPLCCDCNAKLDRINPASVIGARPKKAETKYSYHKVYSNKVSRGRLDQYLIQHNPYDTLPRGKFFNQFRANGPDKYIELRNIYLRKNKQETYD